MKLLSTVSCLAGLCASVLALGQKPNLAFTPSKGALQLAGGKISSQIVIDGRDYPGVVRAAHDLATDFGRTTGTNATVKAVANTAAKIDASPNKPVIIAGTIGNSSLIDQLAKSGKIDVSKTRGQWEAFMTQLVSNPLPGVPSALVVAGSDKRGTIFGLYDLSEQLGVSPWYYFADVPPKKQSAVYAMPMTKIQPSPSVKFRGIFLNDEQPALTNWVNQYYPMGKYGPGFGKEFYSKVYELLLRLKANYIWPAEWNSMFWVDDDQNAAIATEYGVFIGTSHTEPLQRATKEQGLFLNGTWAWATNRENVTDFLRVGAERAKPYEGVWTMGMRGLGDNASPTLNASALAQIIQVEQQILKDTYETDNISHIPQMWCLYKEVGGYFQAGLEVPEDITLLWADDNWGNNQRLPIGNETDRAAGAGVYYHFDYVGQPRDYKWINTIQLQKTYEQMTLAYQRGAQNIWIVNVGDLKTLEVPISHWFDLAYDVPAFSTPDSVSNWTKLWATREFGSAVAAQTTDIMNTYGMLAARRKYELVDPSVYSILNYNEADNVLTEWKNLVDSAQSVYNKLDSATQVAFFEMVLHPALAGYTVHQIHIMAAMNAAYAEQRRTSANTIAQKVLDVFNYDAKLTQRYHNLLNGKWNHILDQTHLGYDYCYVQTLETSLGGNMGVSVQGSNGSVPGDSNYNVALSNNTLILPTLSPYGANSTYIDIYSRGTGSFTYHVSPFASWVKASPSTGTLSATGNTTDQRVLISVDWAAAPAGSNIVFINITSNTGYGSTSMPTVNLPVNKTSVPSSFHGHVEAQGYISIEAEHTTSNTSSTTARFMTIPHYGRTLSGVALTPVTAPSQTPPDAPKLSYSFYAFSNVSNANITAYFGPSLNTIPARPLKYAIAVDDQKPSIIQPCPTYALGTLPAAWNAAVSNSVWTNTTTSAVTSGNHTLNIWLLEPALVFQKVVIDLGGVKSSYLGPPESTIV